MTAAESLYASLRSEADLEKLRSDAATETLHLEFKEKRDRRDGKLHDDDKGNFSACLSAFANSDGGVLLWGIGTRKDASGRDVAHSLKSVTYVDDFRSRLGQFLQDAVQPYVDGVLIEVIPTSSSNTGYVRCLIPASEATPHRAERDHEYYKRTAEGTNYRLEHFDLEDMFGRRSRPSLDVGLECRPTDAGGEHLYFRMRNNGRAVAKLIGLSVSSPAIELVNYGGGFYPTQQIDGITSLFWERSGFIMHPIPIDVSIGDPVWFRRVKPGPITVKVMWYCENMRYRERTFTFP